MFTNCILLLYMFAAAAASSTILGKDDPLLGIAQEYAGKSCAHIYGNNFAGRNRPGYYCVKLTTNEIARVQTQFSHVNILFVSTCVYGCTTNYVKMCRCIVKWGLMLV